MNPFDQKDYLGEPLIIGKGYKLSALLRVCERAARSLENVGDGNYREQVTGALSLTMELADDLACELLSALEDVQPRQGGAK
ncbi:hypothetical protein ASD50_21675 [Mesorhizobium sp. Root552]|uniref:hypothetical protein n=1 Tax=Mesorhizobium sp. Root552 TaxID=1736555 RepID=UPI0006FA2F9F|nr:hypothetical protein [Mesorhizobium sp. Root552]KQZ20304.1 hypothetical protein ASD50_21675 [Mesorhizobium sp. Root552]